MIEEDNIELADQILQAFSFLLNSKQQIDKEINNLMSRVNYLQESINEIDNNSLYNCNSSNIEFFSPTKSEENNRQNLLLKELKTNNENEINEIKKKLEILISNQNSLINSINCINKLENCYRYNLDGYNCCGQNIIGLNILETQENERKRIARDLHDSTVQNLTNVMHKTELCTKLIDIDIIRAKLELQTMVQTIKNTINDMRSIIFNLRPMSIDDLGLIPTVERFINDYNNSKEVKIILNKKDREDNLIPIVKVTLYRVIQEAVNNAINHGKAKNIIIDFDCNDYFIFLSIHDDGIGFNKDKDIQMESNNEILTGFGLSIMKERVMLLSGEINIESDNNGTIVSIKVPLKIQKEDIMDGAH